MKKYNLFILSPNTTDEQVEETNQTVMELIKKNNGAVIMEEKLGKRKLSYPIKKVRHGFYLNYVLDLSNVNSEQLKKMWQELKQNINILRFEFSKYQENKITAKKERGVVIVSDFKKETDYSILQKNKKEAKISLDDLDKKLDDLLESESV